MSFTPATFQAEVMLKVILTERLPSIAQDALEAGFEGPQVLRMAALDPIERWAIDQALPPTLDELGCHWASLDEAALHLAHQRAQRIIETGEDPLLSLLYFHQLMVAADYTKSLLELGYLDDDFYFLTESNVDIRRSLAHEAIQKLLMVKSES